MSERVLIIQMAKLGDFIQTTSLLANLRSQRPAAEIVVAAEQPAAQTAAELSPLVDVAVKIDENTNSLKSLGVFNDIFVLNSHVRPARLAQTVEAENYYGPAFVGGELQFTDIQNFLMALMRLRRTGGRFNLVDVWTSLLPEAGPQPLFWPKPQESELLPGQGGLKIGLQLGSRNHLRRWPTEYFVRLAEGLSGLMPDVKITPVLLGAAVEKALGAKFESLGRERFSAAPVNLVGRTSLKELGQVLAGLDLLVTADTGVMHLAAAVGTPVLALFFGPAYGPETGPYGSGHLIYQALAPCAPCREGGCRHRQCLEMPLPAIAAELAATMLKRHNTLKDNVKAICLPDGHRVWQTFIDGFGQTLMPMGEPALTPDEALAHLITLAGRGLMRPSYQSAVHDLKAALKKYKHGDRPISIDGAFIKNLAENGLRKNRPLREKFEAAADFLTRSVGLEFA